MTLIGVASGDWHPESNIWGGSGWARIGQYMSQLPEYDWVAGTLIWDKECFKIADCDEVLHTPDVIFAHRLMHKGLHEHVKLARAIGQKVISDLDDWYWGLDPSNLAFLASHPKYNDKEDRYSYKMTLSASDLLIVSTQYLADRVRSWVRCPIVVVENTVDVDRFSPVAQTDSDVPLVGWAGSTAHRSGDLETMRGILGPLRRGGEIRLQHSGYHESMPLFADAVGVTPEDVEVLLPLASHEDYPSLLTMEVGIVPLRVTPFNQSKSYIKGLEYAAAGVPFVAQSIDAYDQLREQYGIGTTVRRPADWLKALRRLRDPALRADQAAANRELVRKRDISVGAIDMSSAISTLL